MGTWQVKVATLTNQAQHKMTTAKSAPEAQANLVALLSGAETASETARTEVTDAGVPDVKSGGHLAGQLTTAISAARDAYGKARRTIQQLPTTNDKPFYNAAATTMQTLKNEYEPASADPTKLNSPELKKAFSATRGCKPRP